MTDELAALQKRINISFNNLDLLTLALTHRSHSSESDDTSNERMEFLGDAIIGTVISEYLYDRFANWSEGQLTRAKAALVSEPTLAAVSRKLEVGDALLLSKGEDQGGGRGRSSILCGAFEALVAAIYIDAGVEVARNFIIGCLTDQIDAIIHGNFIKDYKTVLQEVMQEAYRALPTYRVVEETGPDHDKTFVVEVCLNKDILGVGTGKSKKEAEQAAAKHALEKQGEEEQPGSCQEEETESS